MRIWPLVNFLDVFSKNGTLTMLLGNIAYSINDPLIGRQHLSGLREL